MNGAERPVRVLHVVGAMNRGGAETWLMYILRNIDRSQFCLDFLVHTTQPGAYDNEIRSLGSQIIHCPWVRSPLRYARQFRHILTEHGPYDAIHSHVHYFSGLVLRLAAQAGVPVRISHSHSDTSRAEMNAKWYRRLYLQMMRQWLNRYATAGMAASDLAAVALWGSEWRKMPRRQVLYCSVDLEPFEIAPNQQAVRAELGLPPGIPVLGHVGRFDVMKNHDFLVQIAKRARCRNVPLMLLFVGDGPLRGRIEQTVKELDLSDRVLFAGLRADVPRILLGALDVFALPSSWEGMPVSAIEAQAAGLPTLISDTVTREVDIVPGLVCWLSLADGADAWLDACLDSLYKPRPVTQRYALETLRGSPFDVTQSIQKLTTAYRMKT